MSYEVEFTYNSQNGLFRGLLHLTGDYQFVQDLLETSRRDGSENRGTYGISFLKVEDPKPQMSKQDAWITSRLTSLIRTPVNCQYGNSCRRWLWTHVPEITIQHFDISVYDLQSGEFVIARGDPTYEEKRSISSVNDLCIWK